MSVEPSSHTQTLVDEARERAGFHAALAQLCKGDGTIATMPIRFSNRHANEIKREGAVILRAEIIADRLTSPGSLGRVIVTNPGLVVEAMHLLKQCADIARQYHLAATAEDASSRLTGVA